MEVKSLKEAKPLKPAENLTKERKTRKSIIIEGLNEDAHEDIYAAVIGTIKQIGLSIFENNIALAYRLDPSKDLTSGLDQ